LFEFIQKKLEILKDRSLARIILQGIQNFQKKFGFDEKLEAGLFNKSSSLAAAFSVTNFVMNLVNLVLWLKYDLGVQYVGIWDGVAEHISPRFVYIGNVLKAKMLVTVTGLG